MVKEFWKNTKWCGPATPLRVTNIFWEYFCIFWMISYMIQTENGKHIYILIARIIYSKISNKVTVKHKE